MDDLTNLKDETLEVLERNNKTIEDILFITNGKITSYDKENFIKVIDFTYDGGFGGNEINLALKIVGNDWWLERHEYDGSEWWVYKELPTPDKNIGELTREHLEPYPYYGD